jgi:hypothetical protein
MNLGNALLFEPTLQFFETGGVIGEGVLSQDSILSGKEQANVELVFADINAKNV